MKNYSKDNKLIANFMGLKTFARNHLFGLWCCGYDADAYVNYHRSWDWLIPVVQKINKLGNEYPLRVADVMISYNRINIKELHERVVYFINWYNKQNKIK